MDYHDSGAELVKASERGDLDYVKFLVQNGADD